MTASLGNHQEYLIILPWWHHIPQLGKLLFKAVRHLRAENCALSLCSTSRILHCELELCLHSRTKELFLRTIHEYLKNSGVCTYAGPRGLGLLSRVRFAKTHYLLLVDSNGKKQWSPTPAVGLESLGAGIVVTPLNL